MKKIISICIGFILFLWTVMFLASCTPVRYVYIDPKDSVVRKQRVVMNYNFIPSIFYYSVPFYNPVIIQRQRPIIIPQRPHYRPVPSRPPLQRPNTPWRSPRN